ncbi:hypothetical protein Peur_068176 [Populus x canadensis]
MFGIMRGVFPEPLWKFRDLMYGYPTALGAAMVRAFNREACKLGVQVEGTASINVIALGAKLLSMSYSDLRRDSTSSQGCKYILTVILSEVVSATSHQEKSWKFLPQQTRQLIEQQAYGVFQEFQEFNWDVSV